MYVDARQLGRGAATILPATAHAQSDVEELFDVTGFAGLSIQSVGYEKGADKPRIHVYVTKSARKAEKAIEEVDTSVEIKINRIGRVQVKPETASGSVHRGSLYQRKQRIACGSSCAPAGENYAGTLGALVKKKGDPQLFAISNNHVFAAGNHVPVGMPILAPSAIDAGPSIKAPSEIARHAEIIELRSGIPPLVTPVRADVAIATITDPNTVSSWQGGADGYDTPTKIDAPIAGIRVKKYGRTTGLTYGTVEAFINTPTPIPFRCRQFTATVFFQDIWAIRADQGTQFALAGDSGSLVVTEGNEASVGLIFAESSQGEYGLMIPLDHVVELFDELRLISSHGV
jgi:hypothetical protein